MKRNLTKVFLSLFAIFFILVTVTATMCVDAIKTSGIAACKFEPENVPKQVAVEIIASVADVPDILPDDAVLSDDLAVNDKKDETAEIIDKNENISNDKQEDSSAPSDKDSVTQESESIDTSVNEEVNETKPVEIKPLQLVGGYASVDRSAYTVAEIELLDTILERIRVNLNNPEIHEENIPLNAQFDYESYCKVSSYFYVYYGQKRAVDETFDLVNAMREDGYLRLRYDDIREFERVRQQNQAKIGSILSGFTDGSEEHILRQISEYLRSNIIYTDGYYDLSNALNGKSVCNGYALAFNAMANRAGIKSDMCIGKAGGSYHAWNRVTLKDGSHRFYDITFYDSNGKTKYLHSATSFHGSYLINDYTDCWFKR